MKSCHSCARTSACPFDGHKMSFGTLEVWTENSTKIHQSNAVGIPRLIFFFNPNHWPTRGYQHGSLYLQLPPKHLKVSLQHDFEIKFVYTLRTFLTSLLTSTFELNDWMPLLLRLITNFGRVLWFHNLFFWFFDLLALVEAMTPLSELPGKQGPLPEFWKFRNFQTHAFWLACTLIGCHYDWMLLLLTSADWLHQFNGYFEPPPSANQVSSPSSSPDSPPGRWVRRRKAANHSWRLRNAFTLAIKSIIYEYFLAICKQYHLRVFTSTYTLIVRLRVCTIICKL